MALIESFSASLTWTGVHNALISTTQSCQQLQMKLQGFFQSGHGAALFQTHRHVCSAHEDLIGPCSTTLSSRFVCFTFKPARIF